MSYALLEWREYNYFPYELEFARLEVQRVLGVVPEETNSGLRVPERVLSRERVMKLTYFGRIVTPSGEWAVPFQARVEASANGNGKRKQSTRYSAHGLHEYKGKFNPQVVRAIGNILGLDRGQWILDPFCGSGTTLLEAAHIGWNALGTDINPLAVRIANAKLHAFRLPSSHLTELLERVVDELTPYAKELCTESVADSLVDHLLTQDGTAELPGMEYLAKWFTRPVLAQICAAKSVLRTAVPAAADRMIFEVILSDHLRNASLQEPADLRIRRRREPEANYPLLEWFREGLQSRISAVIRARREIGAIEGFQEAFGADIRSADLGSLPAPGGRCDAVITSPPYATALPYVDTQRLSLVAFGELRADQLRETERQLIGAREITGSERTRLEVAMRNGDDRLPHSVLELCTELLKAAGAPENGFRRKNTPALIYRYFRDMAAALVNLRSALRPGAPAALVVGTNRTTLGGREFEIDTPQMLMNIAVHLGYGEVEVRPMDTYPRYDLHQKNSIDSERLIVVAAPG